MESWPPGIMEMSRLISHSRSITLPLKSIVDSAYALRRNGTRKHLFLSSRW